MVDESRSRAVIVFTGKGRSPFPVGDLDAVRALDSAQVEGLPEYVRGVSDEVFALFPLNWGERNNLSADQEKQAIVSTISERHPELSQEAAEALYWMWSYSSWK